MPEMPNVIWAGAWGSGHKMARYWQDPATGPVHAGGKLYTDSDLVAAKDARIVFLEKVASQAVGVSNVPRMAGQLGCRYCAVINKDRLPELYEYLDSLQRQ